MVIKKKVSQDKQQGAKNKRMGHRRSNSATEHSPSSPGGRSLFRKRSSTFSIGDSSLLDRELPALKSRLTSDQGGRRPFGILSVLKEMNETGSFSRSQSSIDLQKDLTTSELKFVTNLPADVSEKTTPLEASSSASTSFASDSSASSVKSLNNSSTFVSVTSSPSLSSGVPSQAPPTPTSMSDSPRKGVVGGEEDTTKPLLVSNGEEGSKFGTRKAYSSSVSAS